MLGMVELTVCVCVCVSGPVSSGHVPNALKAEIAGVCAQLHSEARDPSSGAWGFCEL